MVTEPSHAFGSWWPPGHIIGYEHAFTHTVHDFPNAVAAGKRARPDFEDGVRNQHVLEAIEQAARTKRWVRVGARSSPSDRRSGPGVARLSRSGARGTMRK